MVSGTPKSSYLKEQAEGRKPLETAGSLWNLESRPSDTPLTGPYLIILPKQPLSTAEVS